MITGRIRVTGFGLVSDDLKHCVCFASLGHGAFGPAADDLKHGRLASENKHGPSQHQLERVVRKDPWGIEQKYARGPAHRSLR